ncbi:MAG: VWA domain-containing protein, partial [Anaerolineales bacterium]
MARDRESKKSTGCSVQIIIALIGLIGVVMAAIIGLIGNLGAPITTRLAELLFAPTATPTPTKTPVIVLTPTITDTPTLAPVPSSTPTPTPYYVEIVVDASERMSDAFEGGTTKMESAWQTARDIARIRAQQGQFVTVRLFGGQDSPGGGSCQTSHSLFDFTNNDDQIMGYLAESPTPGGETAVVTALLDASDELQAYENIGREIILLTGGEDGCGSTLSVFYNSDNQSLWTQTFVVLFAEDDFGPFINLEAQGANINYNLVSNRAEAEAVAEKVAVAAAVLVAMVPSPTSLPPSPTTGGEPRPTSTPKPSPPTPTGKVVTATRKPTPAATQPPTHTSTPTNTPTATPTNTPTPTQAPTSEVTYDPGSRTITIHPGDVQAQTGRLCQGKMADIGRKAVFLRAACLQEFGQSAGLLATVTHVYPEKSINVTLSEVEVGQYNDTEIDASGEPLNYSNCAFNAVQDMRNQLGLSSDLGNLNDPQRFDHGTITIQLSSTPAGFVSKEKAVEPGIFATSDQANMASRVSTFRQFYWTTAAINGTAFSPGSDDGTSYRLSYDRVDGGYSGWEIVLPETDVSNLSKLTFDIKGQVGGEIPNVWLTSPGSPEEDIRNLVDIENYVTVNTGWQQVEIPLT